MILRRITEHVKAQNWFAVAIDFVIVVLGVFLGLQVNNWNEARELRASEKSHLAQLRDEVATNIRLLGAQEAYTRELVAAGRRALGFLESDAACAEKCVDLIIDMFHASQIWGTPYPRARYDEVVRIGFPSDEAVREEVDLFYLNMAGWGSVDLTSTPFRATLRGFLSPDASATLWDECFDILDNQIETVSRDCADDIDPADAAATLDAIRADMGVANELRFWIGQNNLFLDEFEDTLRAARTAIDAIDGKTTRTL